MSEERYENGFTIGIFIPKAATKAEADRVLDRISVVVFGEVLKDRGDWDPTILAHPADVFQIDTDDDGHDCCPRHVYLSTSCLHKDHKYCQGETGLIGLKKPGVCKFCEAPCICGCHAQKKEEPVDG